MSIPSSLTAFIDQIESLLGQHQNHVLVAAPGAGKTTLIPPAVAKVCLKNKKGKVIVLEPRRMAAVSACQRIAELNQWTVGQEIGYQVRFENKTSSKTNLIFMTEALLLRKMLSDPDLSDVAVVILDEFHERSQHVDLALGMIRELQLMGSDIQIIAMSATLESEKLATYLGTSATYNFPGTLHELKVVHSNKSQLLQLRPEFYDHVLDKIKAAMAETPKDILVFLPGTHEIERIKNSLEENDYFKRSGRLVQALHGKLSLKEQTFALKPSDIARVILSTNIAESSVTVAGVNTVIDSGLERKNFFDAKTGFSRLELQRISLSSATQRAGRAARQFPGTVYKLWTKPDEISFKPQETPEIRRVDLGFPVLALISLGVGNPYEFSWFEKPSEILLKETLLRLQLSNLIEDANPDSKKAVDIKTTYKVTSAGQKILKYPLDIRLAQLIEAGIQIGHAHLAAWLGALLQEKPPKVDLGMKPLAADDSDLLPLLELAQRSGQFKAVREAYAQILRILDLHDQPLKDSDYEAVPKLLLLAYPDRICRRRDLKSPRALQVDGKGVELAPESWVTESEFFVSLDGRSVNGESKINLASGIKKEFVLSHFAKQIKKETEIQFIEESKKFSKLEGRKLGAILLDNPILLPVTSAELKDRMPEWLLGQEAMLRKESESLDHLLSRLEFLQRTELETSSGNAAEREQSAARFDKNKFWKEMIESASYGCSSLDEVVHKDWKGFFRMAAENQTVQLLDNEAPEKYQAPSGQAHLIKYPAHTTPFVEVRLQEVFGETKTPVLGFGKVKLTFQLLAPNYRAVQVTQSLESFWKNTYAEVRKELRIKYPKHQWPENPEDGIAEAKGKRRH